MPGNRAAGTPNFGPKVYSWVLYGSLLLPATTTTVNTTTTTTEALTTFPVQIQQQQQIQQQIQQVKFENAFIVHLYI